MAIIAISEGERTTLFPEPVGRWVACRRKERTGTRILRSCAPFHFVFATRNIVTLFEKVVVSGISGAAVGAIAGKSRAGAAGAVFNQVAGVMGNDVPEFPLISRRGAFDLTRRLNRDLRNIPRMPELLGSILTRAENAALGLA